MEGPRCDGRGLFLMFNMGRNYPTIGMKRLRARARKKQKGLCYWCKKYVPIRQSTGEHLVEYSKGGRLSKGNIVMACKDCNHSRSEKTEPLQTAHIREFKHWKFENGL